MMSVNTLPVNIEALIRGGWGSGVEPASCYRQDTEPQTAPDVLVGTLHGSRRHYCMNELL